MRRWSVVGIMVGCLVWLGCEQRARVNPLDPLNPSTNGRPQNLQAVAGHQRVSLSWTPIPVADLAGYRLRRHEPGGASAATEVTVSSSSSQYLDQNVVNGKTYLYSLSALIRTGAESPSSDSVIATPGPDACWAIDQGSGTILKIASDARALTVQVRSAFGTQFVAVDPRDGGCWTTSQFGSATFQGAAIRLKVDGQEDVVVSGFTLPGAVAVDPRDGACWVADTGGTIGGTSTVSRLASTGQSQFRLSGFIDPQALAVDSHTGDCWVADTGTGRMTRISSSGVTLLTTGNMGQPIAVAADSRNGGCWGIDRAAHRVFRLRPDGTRIVTVTGLVNPIRLAYSPRDGSCWVADEGGHAIVKLNSGIPDGYDVRQRNDFHLMLPGFTTPLDVAIDTNAGNCWVADADGPAIVKLTPDGRPIGRFTQLFHPIAVSVDPGSRYTGVAP